MKTYLACIFLALMLSLEFSHLNAQNTDEEYPKALKFRSIGPSRGGRVTAVRGVEKDPSVFYMGSTGGGLWKTEDFGHHWKNVSDGYFESPSIGAIAVFQKDPSIIYVGTGSDAIRSNVISGRGIYKSEDAGRTWKPAGLREAGQIGAIEIHPDFPETAFAAVIGQAFRKSAERGVYRTRNGGESWEQVLFLSDSVGAADLELAPGNPDIVYASLWRAERKPWTIISGGAEDGIFKSEDGGTTWRRMSNGLPRGLTGKIDFAVSPDLPSRVWAQVQATGGEGGIYRSDDFAENWVRVNVPPKILRSIMHRPFYFTNLSANPRNADHIWSGAVGLYTSRDGGLSWDRVQVTHGDHHDLWIHPSDTLLLIEGNDGGASVSRDGGLNWSTLNNQPTAELYTCDVDDRHPYYLYSGQQDNSSICVPSRPPGNRIFTGTPYRGMDDIRNWESVGGCETGPVVPMPGNPDVIYANCKGRFSIYKRSSRIEESFPVGAENLYGAHPDDVTYRFQRVSPIEVSPFHPEKVYYGSQYVHMTVNGGRNWERISPDLTANKEKYRMRSGGPIDEDITGEENYAVLYAIEASPLDENVIWTGSNDGLLHLSRDGGRNWKNVTPPMPEDGRVSKIDASFHKAGKALVAVNRDYLGDDRPYFFRTDDFGASWHLLSGDGSGIPDDHPARVLREDPFREGLLFAGTEFGLFMSMDDGLNWISFQRGLPVCPVSDLRFAGNDLAVSTMGRAFWIMDDISPLRAYNAAELKSPLLFSPPDVHNVVQKVYFRVAEETVEEGIRMSWYRGEELIYSYEDSLGKLKPDALGIYMLTWDQHYYLSEGGRILRGPRVAPGTYRVELQLGEHVMEKEFRILMNPHQINQVLPEELQEQETLALEALRLRLEIEKELNFLSDQLKKSRREKQRKNTEVQIAFLKKGPGPYDKPGLLDQVNYLYRILSATPQATGEDSRNRLQELQSSWAGYRAQR